MSEAQILLPLHWGAHGSPADPPSETRCEARTEAVRIVEYCPFPRASAAQGWRVGFTRDVSSSGMCLEVGRSHRVGSLLQLTLRSIDGRPTLEALARVVWCQPGEGSTLVGLSLVEKGRRCPAREEQPGPRPVRRAALKRIA